MEDIFARIRRLTSGEGQTFIRAHAWWRGELRWARNRVSLASDRRDVHITVTRRIRGALVTKDTNQIDDAALARMIHAIEHDAEFTGKNVHLGSIDVPQPELAYTEMAIWSDATYDVTASQRGAVARTLAKESESHGMLSAGYLEMRAYESLTRNFGVDDTAPPYPAADAVNRRPPSAAAQQRAEAHAYWRCTQAQCSMTVRAPDGTGSGWAGGSSFDWGAIRGELLAERALQKCLDSRNPVAIEPGRYTVILEPQAVASFAQILVSAMDRLTAEKGNGPFALRFDETIGTWRSKLGMRVIDDRVTISHDLTNPMLGVIPSEGLTSATWIERGVLTNLMYNRVYALQKLNENLGRAPRGGTDSHSFHMSGGTTTTEDMIATTKRGILITRFSELILLNYDTLITTGVTRDGLWLIEHGKIVKAIRNMRFTESPMFVFNQIEQLGVPAPVFNPLNELLAPVMVPTLKANDFAFTSTIDAV